MLKLFCTWPDEHVPHEEGVVGAATDNTDVDSVAFIPTSKPIYDIDAAAGI